MAVGSLHHHCTTTVPFSMFIPQANPISPVFAGVNSITTGSFNGKARLIFSVGKTISVPHVLSVVRDGYRL
jgi:hypothetical protein